MRDDTLTSSRQTTATLEADWQRLGVHRASQAARPVTWSTGLASLDRILPGRGYPLASVTEWLIERAGIGELSLLLAGMGKRLQAYPNQRLILLNPPYALSAPALDACRIDRSRVPVLRCSTPAEAIWSIEQLADAGGFVGFVLWEDQLEMTDLRRLQLASEKAGCPVFVYRHMHCARQRSPAALRLVLTQRAGKQHIEVLKCRGPGGARAKGLYIGRDRPWQPARFKATCRLGSLTPAPSDNDTTADGTTRHGSAASGCFKSSKSNENNAAKYCFGYRKIDKIKSPTVSRPD